MHALLMLIFDMRKEMLHVDVINPSREAKILAWTKVAITAQVKATWLDKKGDRHNLNMASLF